MGIFINEVGYYKNAVKHASVTDADSITLVNADGKEIKQYDAKTKTMEPLSGEDTAVVDFSDITDEGTYYFIDNNGNKSCKFVIDNDPYKNLANAALRMFYFQRCGCELTEKYAGVYKHPICHTGKIKYIYDDSNKMYECNGGWHDAGDFGRYTTAGAVAVAHLLYAYMLNPDKFEGSSNIPESGNGIPDILNECKYELDWMLQMQTEDGGVYHKLTSMVHAPFQMPQDDKLQFITTPVSSLAVADFAAVCALASRIYRPFLPEYADTLEKAALKSGKWLDAHKGLLFDEPSECKTGGYGDLCDLDERLWADAELYLLDKDEKHIQNFAVYLDMHISLTSLGWMDVGGLASVCVLTNEKAFPEKMFNQFKYAVLDEADRLTAVSRTNTYDVAMHPHDFKWGSNMVLLTNAMLLCIANRFSDKDYRNEVLFQIDYLLGRNALDISYVTGFGDNAFKNPHNRPTATDGIDAPIPGYVSGGPNVDFCDEDALKLIKKGTPPMKCYVDVVGAYSTNEITIYWNSPLVFVLSCL